jgi:hypothetical protein
MILKGPEHYYVSLEKEDDELLPMETMYCYNILRNKYGYTGRMSNFPVFLSDIFEVKEFEFFDPHKWNTAEFLSYLLELQIKYQNGETIDMAQLHKDILGVYQFTRKEKRMFIEESIEKRLWSIFIFLNNPNKDNIN